jgi:hypothetical protein
VDVQRAEFGTRLGALAAQCETGLNKTSRPPARRRYLERGPVDAWLRIEL